MLTRRTLSVQRVLSIWAIGVVMTVAMLGQALLLAPRASADCTLHADDEQYIHLLAQQDIVHAGGFTDCHVAAEGRWFADQVRTSADPLGTARSLVRIVRTGTSLSTEQAIWEVAAAIYVFAPEMVPVLNNQGAAGSA